METPDNTRGGVIKAIKGNKAWLVTIIVTLVLGSAVGITYAQYSRLAKARNTFLSALPYASNLPQAQALVDVYSRVTTPFINISGTKAASATNPPGKFNFNAGIREPGAGLQTTPGDCRSVGCANGYQCLGGPGSTPGACFTPRTTDACSGLCKSNEYCKITAGTYKGYCFALKPTPKPTKTPTLGSCGGITCATGQTCKNGQCSGGTTTGLCNGNICLSTQHCDENYSPPRCEDNGTIGGGTANCQYDTCGSLLPGQSTTNCNISGPPGNVPPPGGTCAGTGGSGAGCVLDSQCQSGNVCVNGQCTAGSVTGGSGSAGSGSGGGGSIESVCSNEADAMFGTGDSDAKAMYLAECFFSAQ